MPLIGLEAQERQVAKINAGMPDELRGLAVLLTFDEPIARTLTGEFLRIFLRAEWMSDGNSEGEFYRAEVFQPWRSRVRRKCPQCGMWMSRKSVNEWVCRYRLCSLSGRILVAGPTRGVIRTIVFDDFVVETVDGVEMIDRILLVLDRRYRDPVLAGVYRTAGEICEVMGWKLAK